MEASSSADLRFGCRGPLASGRLPGEALVPKRELGAGCRQTTRGPGFRATRVPGVPGFGSDDEIFGVD